MASLLQSHLATQLSMLALCSLRDFQNRNNASKKDLVGIYIPHFSLMCSYAYFFQFLDFDEILFILLNSLDS